MKARKEITIAVIIGLLIGVVVVFGIVRARSALNNLNPQDLSLSNKKSTSPKESANPNQELYLTLETPDNQVLTSPELTVQGSTLPGTYIVILDESAEHIIIPNDVGSFSQTISLVAGANTIKVTVYQSNGTSKEQTLNAVYTTAEI